jgi:hypothetical protein
MLVMKRSHWINLAMIGALLGIAVAGHRYSPLLLPRADVFVVPAPGCDLHKGPCAATWPGGGHLEFSVTPRPIPYLHPLRVEVVVSGVQPGKVEVDFAGETMNMGYNRIELKPSGGGRHAGEASLPVCVSGSMDWVATVIVEADGKRISAPYRFATGR